MIIAHFDDCLRQHTSLLKDANEQYIQKTCNMRAHKSYTFHAPLSSLSLSLIFIYIYIPPEQHITPQYCTFVNNSSNLPLYMGHIHSSVLEAPDTKTNSLCVQTDLAIKLFWFSLSLSQCESDEE